VQNIVYHSNNIVTILYIFKVCIQSTCTQSVICHVVCYAQPQKATISCSFYLPPCFLIPPATTAVSIWLIYNCILIVELYIDFLCYFCVFLAAETQVPSVYGTAGASIDWLIVHDQHVTWSHMGALLDPDL